MCKIVDLKAREVLDSRGFPTIEVECYLESGDFGRAQVPAGASVGKYEALELRDGDKQRYAGKGVSLAIRNIETIIKKEIIGLDATRQREIDRLLCQLDATENKKILGANAILAVSLACCRAACHYYKMPLYRYLGGLSNLTLPVPLLNIINGGAHAGNNLDIQEYLIVPLGRPTFKEALRAACEVFYKLKELLSNAKLSTAVGDEGGFAPNFSDNEEPLKFITEAIKKSGYEPGKDIFLALDIAATNFFSKKDNLYHLKLENKSLSATELVDIYERWISNYPIISLEDGLEEEDWEGWQYLTQRLANKIQLVGDDIFVTNISRLKEGLKKKVANAILIKPNQIGTLTETIDCINFAKQIGYKTIISHRSGETEDSFIADLAVGTNAGQIKTGAPCRGERIAKYNQLLRIEEEINGRYNL